MGKPSKSTLEHGVLSHPRPCDLSEPPLSMGSGSNLVGWSCGTGDNWDSPRSLDWYFRLHAFRRCQRDVGDTGKLQSVCRGVQPAAHRTARWGDGVGSNSVGDPGAQPSDPAANAIEGFEAQKKRLNAQIAELRQLAVSFVCRDWVLNISLQSCRGPGPAIFTSASTSISLGLAVPWRYQ
jgi:hypothetical protein